VRGRHRQPATTEPQSAALDDAKWIESGELTGCDGHDTIVHPC